MNHVHVSDVLLELRRLTRATSGGRVLAALILLNLCVLFMRPQDLGGLGFLGTIRIPVIVSIFPLVAWVVRANQGWTFQTRVMMAFLLVEGFRTVIGKMIWEDLVVNDFWAFNIWKDLFLQFCTLVFPFVVFMRNTQLLRMFLRAWAFIGAYLAIYIITHGGKGPGGFLGDENDAGLALLLFLPFSLAYLIESKMTGMVKLRAFFVSAMVLVGVVATVSRGAFVGLVCILAYFFWRSKRKLMLLFSGLVLVGVAAAFMPEEYVNEMRSIQDTSSGTAEMRKHYWKLATKVWLDPRFTVAGVGLNNVTFHLGNYESAADLEKYPSASGRAVHSFYFQLLPDLGLWGVAIVGALFLRSYRTNRRLYKRAEVEIKRLGMIANTAGDGQVDESAALVRSELEFLRPLLMAVNISFIGFFSAGAFISVLYYPMFWFLCGLSAVLDVVCSRFFSICDELSK